MWESVCIHRLLCGSEQICEREPGRGSGLSEVTCVVLCSSDQRGAVLGRLRSAGRQLPAGHHHHLPAQRRMREEDLHPGWIHADGCRLVQTVVIDNTDSITFTPGAQTTTMSKSRFWIVFTFLHTHTVSVVH